MDKMIESYIESLVLKVLQAQRFINLSEGQRGEYAQKLRDHFNEVIFETLINNLSPEQLNDLKNLGLGSVQAREKIEEYSSLIPLFSTKLEVALNAEVEKFKSMQSGEVWKRQ